MLKAALIPSQCDTLKCVCENFKVAVPKVPVIGVTIPNNRTIQAAHGPVSYTHLDVYKRQVYAQGRSPLQVKGED